MLQNNEKLIYLLLILAAVVILIIISVVVLFSVFVNRKNTLIRKNLETELANQHKQHVLELKALRSQMNPHFVHNSLNAIQYYIQKNDVETSEVYLAKFSKLMRQFFDYSRLHKISLTDEISLLDNYLQIEKLRFEENLNYIITLDPNLDAEETYIPAMLLQPLVENSINHGLFHKKGKGTVSVSFAFVNEASFIVVVKDDGIGIDKAKKLNNSFVKGKEAHSSHVLEERLHFLKESNSWDIEYEINDLSQVSDETGTEVKLIFNLVN